MPVLGPAWVPFTWLLQEERNPCIWTLGKEELTQVGWTAPPGVSISDDRAALWPWAADADLQYFRTLLSSWQTYSCSRLILTLTLWSSFQKKKGKQRHGLVGWLAQLAVNAMNTLGLWASVPDSRTRLFPLTLWHTGTWIPELGSGFPRSSVGKEPACNAGDLGSVPELGRCPGGVATHSSILAWRDRGAWWAAVHGVPTVGHHLATKPPPTNSRCGILFFFFLREFTFL